MHLKNTSKKIALTCVVSASDSQPALRWFSSSWDVALVESFMRLVNIVDDQSAGGDALDKDAIFIEGYGSGGFGEICPVFTAQTHSASLHHRN